PRIMIELPLPRKACSSPRFQLVRVARAQPQGLSDRGIGTLQLQQVRGMEIEKAAVGAHMTGDRAAHAPSQAEVGGDLQNHLLEDKNAAGAQASAAEETLGAARTTGQIHRGHRHGAAKLPPIPLVVNVTGAGGARAGAPPRQSVWRASLVVPAAEQSRGFFQGLVLGELLGGEDGRELLVEDLEGVLDLVSILVQGDG